MSRLLSINESTLTNIADAIRAKTGNDDLIHPGDMPAKIADIQTGIDTSDATATADDILQYKTAYADNRQIEGTIRVAHGGFTDYVEPSDVGYMPFVQMLTHVDRPTCIAPNSGNMIRLQAPYSSFGDATAEDVAKGKTFTGAGGFKVEGNAPTYADGYTEGYQAHYNEFWSNQSTTQWVYRFAGRTWNANNFKPNFNINIIGNGWGCFYNSGINTDLVQHLADLGLTMSTSQMTNGGSLFQDCLFTRVGVIDTSNAASITMLFYGAVNLHTIDKLILKSDGSQVLSRIFLLCNSLENLIIEGTIGQNGLSLESSTKLSKESIESIINALSTTTTGLSITLSKTAVDNAFHNNIVVGSNTMEWGLLKNSRSNWTINLV